jgi:hypothetical protein
MEGRDQIAFRRFAEIPSGDDRTLYDTYSCDGSRFGSFSLKAAGL